MLQQKRQVDVLDPEVGRVFRAQQAAMSRHSPDTLSAKR